MDPFKEPLREPVKVHSSIKEVSGSLGTLPQGSTQALGKVPNRV